MSWPIPWDKPASDDPIRNITIEAMNTPLRPYRSPSFAHTGVDTAVASAYPVTTQDR